MTKISKQTIALAASLGVMAVVGTADAEGTNLDTTLVGTGYASWVQGPTNNLYTDPDEAHVGIGTAFPEAALHIHNQYDANLASSNYTALRLTTDVTDGQEILLMDSNELMTGKYITGGSVIPHMTPSRMHLQHDGGELMINGGLSYWTLFSAGGISAGGSIHVRSSADIASNIFNGPLMVGPSSRNLALDGNEIMARSNGAPSELHLNAEGGSVIFHGAGSMPASAAVVFYENGRVRIGESNSTYAASAKLSVDGLVVAEELRVTPDGWADDVFAPGYAMRSASELEAYVRKHRHLPGIASEQSVMKDGLQVASFSTNILRNVEELTLRVVEQSKQLESERQAHARELDELRRKYDARLAKLEAKIDQALVRR